MAAVKAGIVPASLAGDMPPAPPVVKKSERYEPSPGALPQSGRLEGKTNGGGGLDLLDLPDELDDAAIKQILDRADEVGTRMRGGGCGPGCNPVKDTCMVTKAVLWSRTRDSQVEKGGLGRDF